SGTNEIKTLINCGIETFTVIIDVIKWRVSRPTNNDVAHTILYPVHLGMKTITTINQRDFIIIVIQDGFVPGYLCQSGSLQSNTCKSSSEAVTYIYQQAFFTKTRLDGLLVMGFDDPEICKTLLTDVHFHPYNFKIGNIILTIFKIGKSNNSNWNYAGKGYLSSFVYNFHKTRSLFVQEFSNKEAIVRIYQNFQEAYVFRSTLFGLEHEQTKSEINKEQNLTCTVEKWQNEQIMQNQESNIIKLITELKKIYPLDYTIKDCELHAWKALLRHTGCTNITPFGKESK
ncbi:9997_t:CDS:2, partial [Gigaspora rosea]